MHETPLTALVLSGGGARAAYQVGVLRTIARLRRELLGPREARLSTPFGIIVGTSAGAINAAALACQADRFDAAVEVLSRVWGDFASADVYRAEAWGRVRTAGAPWLTMLSLGRAILRWRRARTASLLDNAPLAALLGRLVPLERLPMLLAQRQLHGVAITASRYGTGEHVTFYDTAAKIAPWTRSGRIAVPSRIRAEHLLASSAIPFIFPPTRIASDVEAPGWYGDGSMRQTAPLAPAIHLGAERLLVIGAGRVHGPPAAHPAEGDAPPTLAQIAGHAMAGIFLDALTVDVERMQRINRTLALLPDGMRQDTPLRPLESLVISPSQRIDDIAARHAGLLPPEVRRLVHGRPDPRTGAAPGGGGALASYLLFEAPFTRELIALGEADSLARRDEILQFFAWQPRRRAAAAMPLPGVPLDIVLP